MSANNNNVDSDALRQAASALATYISDIQLNIQRMKDAATDCSDNMGSDVYSQRSITKLNDCVKGLEKTIVEAEELKERILKTVRKIENS